MPEQFEDVMLDIETLGTSENSIVLSIAAIAFNLNEVYPLDWNPYNYNGKHVEHFSFNLDIDDQHEKGRVIEPGTLTWWLQQEREAIRRAFFNLEPEQSKASYTGHSHNMIWLQTLNAWLSSLGEVRIWGNGATFDNVIIRSLYNTYGLQFQPSFRADCCYRTIRNLPGNHTCHEWPKHLTKHVPMDDAIYQILNLQRWINK